MHISCASSKCKAEAGGEKIQSIKGQLVNALASFNTYIHHKKTGRQQGQEVCREEDGERWCLRRDGDSVNVGLGWGRNGGAGQQLLYNLRPSLDGFSLKPYPREGR